MTRNNSSQPPTGEVPSVRYARRGGVRRNVSSRVTFFVTFAAGPRVLDGWALNISYGGLRAIVEEEQVDVDTEVEVLIGDDPVRRLGRIVWAQNEPDGTIVGIEFHEPLAELPPSDTAVYVGPSVAPPAMKPDVAEAAPAPPGEEVDADPR